MEMLGEITSLMQEMIRNKCINPPGNEMKSIRTVERFLSSYGIESEILESAPERGNLLAVMEGSGNHPSFMLGPAHVDVVPVENEKDWKVPPFEGTIKDDCIWGRGSLDMLYIVASQTVVFAKLHQEGFKPKGDLKLCIVADEEASGNYGANWLVQNHPEKVRVDYLITEAGGDPIGPNRITYVYGEKGTAWTRLRFLGEESHGSAPYNSNNAVVKMSKAIQRISEYQPPRHTSLLIPFIKAMGIGTVTRVLMGNTKTLGFMFRQLSKRNKKDAAFLNSMTQMTISPNVCEGGAKVNTIPGQAYVDVDVRTLPGQDEEYVIDQFQKALAGMLDDVIIEAVPVDLGGGFNPGNISEMESPLVRIMESVIRELRGKEITLVPMVSPGATDSRFFRRAFGTNAYGFSIHDGTLEVGEIMSMFHGTDERVPLGTLELTSNGYMEIIRKLLS
ncbi:M20/M25/M40 family metallo-hydrolase [Candidatus Thorarchaeota archaeon]|nr:MAG: M20/M25/M40 family metallo-hydrolase [Candidatus Thorarchaeota archaeon]